ncbi:MAG TPA: family 16 glycosylhydrolase [Candidatus Dormibacteraeota bacterium]|nr:family 16 glycosylhydrolase [Candidatus Dormibacteraeota bacterium]
MPGRCATIGFDQTVADHRRHCPACQPGPGSGGCLASRWLLLVWGDEFNATSLDTNKWDFWVDNRTWGKAYNDGAVAVSVSSGHLVITTQTINGTNYTAMVASDNHFRPRYGYYEASIKWGDYSGMWSAFWLRSPILGTYLNDPLDDGGEMDVCEHRYTGIYGTNTADIVSDNIHWNGYGSAEQSTGSPNIGTGLATGFHTYSLLWGYDSYDFGIDGSTAWHTGSDGSPPTPAFGSGAYMILSSQVDDGPDVGTPPWAGTIPSGGYPTGTNQLLVDYFHFYAPTNVLFWTGGTSAYWTNTANWVANMPPLATSDLTFSYLSGALSNILGSDYAVHGLIFLGTTNSASINGINILSLGAGGIDMLAADHNMVLNAPINLAADQTWTMGRNNPGNVLTVNGNLAGTAKLTKAGYGQVNLTGANTSYSGKIIVTTGILAIQTENNLGATPGTAIADSITLDPPVNISGNNWGLRCQNSSVSLSATRGIYLGTKGGAIQCQNGKTLTINGMITGPGGLWAGGGTAGAGIGGITLMNPGNNYSGGTYIFGGNLTLGANNVLPTGTPLWMGTSASGSGTYFNMNGKSQTIGTLTGTAPPNGPQLTLSGALTIQETSPTTFAGVILGAGGSLILDSTSTSTLTLTAVNTYTGPTTINGGTLALSGAGAIGSSSTIEVARGGAFDVSARSPSFTLGNSQTLKAGGTGASSATIATASGQGLTLGASSPLQFTAYDGSTVPLTIAGAGSLAIGTGNAVTVTTTAHLASGSYKLVQIGSGNTAAITGSPASSVTVNGSGASGNSSLQISGGELYLSVAPNLAPVTQMSIGPGSGGNVTINYSGGNGSQFVLLQTNNVAAPMSNWRRLQTNTGSFGSFTITRGSDLGEFYVIKSE